MERSQKRATAWLSILLPRITALLLFLPGLVGARGLPAEDPSRLFEPFLWSGRITNESPLSLGEPVLPSPKSGGAFKLGVLPAPPEFVTLQHFDNVAAYLVGYPIYDPFVELVQQDQLEIFPEMAPRGGMSGSNGGGFNNPLTGARRGNPAPTGARRGNPAPTAGRGGNSVNESRLRVAEELAGKYLSWLEGVIPWKAPPGLS